MKIIYHSDTFLPEISGVTTSIINFSKQLEKRGHQIMILTSERKEHGKMLGRNIFVKYFKATDKLINYPDFLVAYPNVYKTWKTIREFEPQIIHSHTPSPQAWTLLFMAQEKNLPYVATYHTILPDFINHTALGKLDFSDLGKKITWFYSKLYYERADLIITPSEAIKRTLLANNIKNRIETVSNGINLEKFRPAARKDGARKAKILHLGRISYEKNIDVLIDAAKILKDKNAAFRLTIVGGGPDLERMRKKSEKLGLSDEVAFAGPVSHDEVEAQYMSHDIFATASTIETEGLVILEAMACGLPVVGVDSLAVPEIISHDNWGFIAPPKDARALAGYLERLIKDKDLRSRFAEKSIQAASRYALANSIDRVEMLYQELIEEKKRKIGQPADISAG